jgi:lipid-A-disaccharide synthase
VELAFDLTEHSIIGFPTPKGYLHARGRFQQLIQLAIERQPEVIIGIDYNYFNLRFAHEIKRYAAARRDWFHDWKPKLVKYVSPQVWASREGRANEIANDFDLLLSIFPFEKDWYAKRVPKLHVEFVGHPMVERFFESKVQSLKSKVTGNAPRILLLPGSRRKELQRHLPVMLEAFKLIRERYADGKARIVLPNESLAEQAKAFELGSSVEIQIGKLPEALATAALAIASTGTVTMECAFFGVPAITLYKTSWGFYHLAKHFVKVKSLTMPNLMAGEEVFSEFIQNDATPENISRAALELLQNESRRQAMRVKMAAVVASLGGPGASRRAARAIASLLESKPVERIRG